MRNIPRKYSPFLQPLWWAPYALIMAVAKTDFRDFLRADFWLDMGLVCLVAITAMVVLAGVFYAYYRFCRWFGRAVDRERSRIADRVAARAGVIAWPASDPLHDPELDA